MTRPGSFDPDEKSMQAMGAIAGLRVTPGETFAVDGPGGLGPESAGAVIVLHATLTTDAGAQTFYQRNATLLRALADAPGFIRFLGISDGPSLWGVGFWRTPEEALLFSRGDLHRGVVVEHARAPFQYSQFAGIWAAHTIRPRRFFCTCGATNAAPATACASCGAPIVDVFRTNEASSSER